jgi:hypothetical protein
MVLGAPPTHHHEVHILTSSFQFSGELETVGDTFGYVDDAARECLSLHDARLAPLTPGNPMKGLHRPLIVVQRPQVAFLYFASAETRESIRLLTRKEPLVAYTPVAVCCGNFHITAEARVRDFIETVAGYFIPVTDAQIFPLVDLPAPFPLQVDLLLLGRDQIQTYHPA